MGWFSDLAPIIGAGVGAAGSIGAGLLSANAVERSADRASDAQLYMFDQLREDQAPYRRAGRRAVTELDKMLLDGDYSGFEASPGYQFRLDEGTKAMNRSAAAQGLLNSGPQMKALTRYGQDYASNEFNNYTNRLSALAGLGQTATQATGNAGQSAANNQSNFILDAGRARGSAYENVASSVNQGINNSLFYMLRN